MEYNEFKEKLKDNLKETEKKLEEQIKALQTLKNAQEYTYEQACKFLPGKFIQTSKDEYVLITGKPRIDGEVLKVPIRNYIEAYTDNDSCYINASGCITLLNIPLNKIDDCNIITLNDYFILKKDKLKKDIDSFIRHNKNAIENAKRRIESYEDEIKNKEAIIEEYKNFNIENCLPDFITEYSKSNRFNSMLSESYTSENFWKRETTYCYQYDYNFNKNEEK